MNQPQQTARRIVSKGAYAVTQTKRAGMSISALAVLFCAAACVGVSAFLVYAVLVSTLSFFSGLISLPVAALYWLLLLVFGYATWRISVYAVFLFRRAVTIDPGIPLTRANTADLPAPESLVRASEEPPAALEMVLVRPSSEVQDTPPEQLIRAAGEYG